MDGILRCSHYAFGPNRLHYCGPDANREILAYMKEGVTDFGLKRLLAQFHTMYPYLHQIALSNKISDPFEDRVVEAYWIGNGLLENVSQKAFYDHLVDGHHMKKRLNIKSFSKLKDKVRKGALPHHSFHVFNIWKRTGHTQSAHTLESIDACRISWGKVLSVEGPHIIVETRPIKSMANKLILGSPIEKKVIRHLESEMDEIKVGDTVSIHWEVPCEVLSLQQVEDLKKYTLLSLQFANIGV